MKGYHFSLHHFTDSILRFPIAAQFIRKNKLWLGFWEYKWVAYLLILGGAWVSFQYYGLFMNWWQHLDFNHLNDAATESGKIGEQLKAEGKDVFVSSSLKYFILILMEIVIFHTVGRTIEIISDGNKRTPTFKLFVRAQVRMVQISIHSWFKELIATIILSIILGILGMNVLKGALIFIVQCYYVGFAMVDNYNERLGMKVKESDKFSQKYAGVVLGVGLVVYLLMMIPVAGSFFGPLLGGVTATLVMHQLLQPDQNEAFDYSE